MIRETMPVGPLQCNCSILGDETSREAIVIDPGADVPQILAAIQKHGLTVKQIIVTHAHIDHIAGAHELKALTGAPILYNEQDLHSSPMMDVQAGWLGMRTVPIVTKPDATLNNGDTVGVNGLKGEILLTPGHTMGSICVYLPTQELLIAGDTLFAGSVGRTDLPGGDTRQLIRSIHDRLLVLPDETKVIPGHGSETSIGRERASNPFLQSGSTFS